jgi:hypothetical protein
LIFDQGSSLQTDLARSCVSCFGRSGFNIASFLLAHKNIDWRDKSQWNCNNNKHPTRNRQYGLDDHSAISVHPLETLFHVSEISSFNTFDFFIFMFIWLFVCHRKLPFAVIKDRMAKNAFLKPRRICIVCGHCALSVGSLLCEST